jgi:hypothetical protein
MLQTSPFPLERMSCRQELLRQAQLQVGDHGFCVLHTGKR